MLRKCGGTHQPSHVFRSNSTQKSGYRRLYPDHKWSAWEFYWTVVAENQGSKAVMQRTLLIINQVVQVEWASSHSGSHWLTKRKMEEKPERGQTFGSQSRRKRGWQWNLQSWSPLGLTWDEVWPWGWDGASVKATEVNKVKEWGSNDAEGSFIATEVSCDDGKSEMKGKTLSQDQSPVNGGEGTRAVKGWCEPPRRRHHDRRKEQQKSESNNGDQWGSWSSTVKPPRWWVHAGSLCY